MTKTSHHILFLDGLQKALSRIQDQSPGMIVIHGSCEYFIFKALNAIKTIWKQKTSSASFTWEAEELKKETFYELCEQRNLFEKASLHVIRKLKKQVELASWISSLNSPPQNLLVITTETEKLAPKFQICAEKLQAFIIPCQKPFKTELGSIANQLLKKRKLNLAPDALKKLLTAVGEDLYTLENEIDRLSLLFTDEKPVNSAQLAPFLSSLSEEQSFKLVNLLLEHKHAQAHLFVSELLCQGESPISIAGLLAWHCRNTLKIFESARSSHKPTTLRLSYTLLKGYQHYIKTIKPIDIIQAMRACQHVDTALKSTSIPAEELLALPLLCLNRQTMQYN